MAELEEYRKEIDKIDSDLLEKLSERNKIIEKIDNLKKIKGIPVCDSKREKEIFSSIEGKAVELGLDKDYVRRIVSIILENSKKIQAGN